MAEKKQGRPDGRPRTGLADLAGPDPDAKLAELEAELLRLRFQWATRQLTNTSRIRLIRKDIARVKTYQRQRELMAQVAGLAAHS